MDQYIGPSLALATALLTFVYGYGKISSRLDSVEKDVAQAVTRAEFKALADRMAEMVAELRGLRQELITVLTERNH